jgi:glycosyltransferase involved in cell wall biosynthesis
LQVLFISDSFPLNVTRSIHGIFKRMELFLHALTDHATLNMFFFVPAKFDITPSIVEKYRVEISKSWKISCQLKLFPKADIYENQNKWSEYGAGIFDFFKQSAYFATSGRAQVAALIDSLSENPDIIFVHRLNSFCPLLKIKEKLPPIYFDLDDIEHKKFFRDLNQPPKWMAKNLLYLHIPALLWGEHKAIRLSECTVVCSEQDKRYLEKICRRNSIVAIPNAVRIPNGVKVPNDQTVLFLGDYWYKPNANAAEYIIENIWPAIQSEIPEAKLILAGKNPQYIKYYKSDLSKVEFTGFINELDSLYNRTRVVCTPIFSGGGTRFKILEAAAYGKSIVSTSIGVEGIGMVNEKHFIMRNNAQSMADACIRLLKDYKLCEQIGKEARELVANNYQKDKIVQLIQKNFFLV